MFMFSAYFGIFKSITAVNRQTLLKTFKEFSSKSTTVMRVTDELLVIITPMYTQV